jgi:hypothetical protein
MAAGFDLSSILQQAVSLTNNQTQLAQQEASLLQAGAEASLGQASNIGAEAALTAQITSAEGQLKLQAQNQNRQVAQLAGTQLGGPTDVLGPLLQGMQLDAQKLISSQAKVSELESNSDLITNPLGFLKHLVQGDGARAERDAVAANLDAKQKTAQALNSATQQSVMTQEAIKETVTQSMIVDMAEMDVLRGQIKAAEATKQSYQFGAQAVGVMRQLGAENFNRATNMYQLMTDDARYKEGLELRKEQIANSRLARRSAEDELKYYDEATSRINNFRAKSNLPPMQAHQVRAQLNQNSKLGETLREQEYRGYILEDMGDMGPVYGNTVSESINLLQSSGAQMPAQYEEMAGAVIGGAFSKLEQEITAQALASQNPALAKDKKFRDRVLDNLVKAEAMELTKDIQPGKGNPYELPKLDTMLGAVPEIASSAFGQKILSPLAAAGQQDVNPEQLLALAADAINRGELSFNEARDGYAALFQNGVGLRNASGGFLALSVPTATGYQSKIKAFQPGFVERNATLLGVPSAVIPGVGTLVRAGISAQPRTGREMQALDHTKPEDVTLALTIMTTKKKASAILDQYNSGQ